jgi:plastocyanin
MLCRPGMLLCLLACSFVALFLAKMESSSAHEQANGVVVHLTEEGFEPESVKVGAGETIVFENVDDEGHWPASNDHPTHEIYPAFDPKKPVQPGTNWSVTLDRPGEWGYHDHMNPYMTGKVIVVKDRVESGPGGLIASIGAFFANVYEATVAALVGTGEDSAAAGGGAPTQGGGSGELSDDRYEEARDELTSLVREENPRVALNRLGEEMETDDAILRSCHPLVHAIGHEAYEKYRDVGEAMKYRNEVCNSGYLHGVIERRFSESEDILADVKTMCEPYRPGSFVSWQCYHGLGHGVMFYTANDLPRSLEMCEGLDTEFGRSNCVNGVFMENFTADQKLHVSKFLKESDPFYPCQEQADHLKSDCYIYAPTYFLNLNPNDYAAALEWCRGAETGFDGACAYGVGMQVMKENLNEPGFVESTCTNGAPGQTQPCIQGMTALYISHHGSLEPARELCGRLEPSNQPACYATVKAHTSLFTDRSST